MKDNHIECIGFFDSWRLGSKDRIQMLLNLANRGDYLHLPMGTYFFNQPDAILHVLQSHADKFQKKQTPYDQMMEALGPGVLTEDNKAWADARSRLQAHFTAKRIDQQVSQASSLVIKHLQSSPQAPFSLCEPLHHLVTQLMLELLCGYTDTALATAAGKAIALCNIEVASFSPFKHPIAKRRKLQKALTNLDHSLLLLADQFSPDALLGPLISAYQQGNMHKKHFLGEMKNFLIAGAETTASTLAWIIYNITAHPECMAQVVNEIRSTSTPNAWTGPVLPYTQMCIEETLRLYPSIWTILRRSIKKSHFSDITIEKNSIIVLPPFTIHRHPAFWQHPEKFNPHRFDSAHKAQRPKGVYLPFGIGKRVFIGKQLALASMKMILHEWLCHYDLSQPVIKHPGLQPLVTLQPHDRIVVQMKEYPRSS